MPAQLRAKNTGPIGTLALLANLGRHAQLDGIGLSDLYNSGGRAVDRPGQRPQRRRPDLGRQGTRLSLGAGACSLFADFADDAALQAIELDGRAGPPRRPLPARRS